MKIAFLIKKLDITTPMGIEYLSAILKKHNYDVCLILFKDKDYINQLKIFKPDIIAYSITTGHHKETIEINKEVKKHLKVYSIFGGPHPTFYPEMIEEEGVDAICIGEGEYSIIDFLEKLKKFGKNGSGEHLEITFTDNNKEVKAISFFSNQDSFQKSLTEGLPVNLLATFDLSRFRGREELRLRVVDII